MIMHDRYYQLEHSEQYGLVVTEDRLHVPAEEFNRIMPPPMMRGKIRCQCLCHGYPEGVLWHDDGPCCEDGWADIPENLCIQFQNLIADR